MVEFQSDSGATVNVIPANLAPNELEESSCTLKMSNKTNYSACWQMSNSDKKSSKQKKSTELSSK